MTPGTRQLVLVDRSELYKGKPVKALTEGRGADMIFVATNANGLVEEAVRISRPGAKIMPPAGNFRLRDRPRQHIPP